MVVTILALYSGGKHQTPLTAVTVHCDVVLAQDLQEIARGYAAHSIPLDMIVSDMAWHYHDERKIDWAGYSWSKSLFPAPEVFKSWLEQEGMNFTLNLHLGRVQPPPVTPPEMWGPFVNGLLPNLSPAEASKFNFSLPCRASRYSPGTSGIDAECNTATNNQFNYTVTAGLVASKQFAESYMALLDTSGSRLQWLDDQPRCANTIS